MYSPKIIEANLDVANSLLRQQLQDSKFYLERHTVEQVEDACDIIKKAKLKLGSYDKLPTSLRRFILNEKTLCKLDYLYWATRYAWIKGLRNRVQRYQPNLAQQIVQSVYEEMEEKGVEILVQWLKARRLGISTDSELRIQHRIQFFSNVTSIVGSSDPTSSGKMFKMLQFSWRRQPEWLIPDITRFKEGLFYEYSNENYLSIEHGTQFKNIGVGNDPSVFHLSECFAYDKPEELIDSGLMPAIIPDPFVFGVLESTAEGDEGWWYDSYWFNKENYSRGIARFRAYFLPWFVGRDLYPNETYLRKNPVPVGWEPEAEILLHAAAARKYVQETPLLKKHMGDWTMPLEQMWYHTCKKREYREKKILHIFFSQFPASDREAFSTGRGSVFDAETLEKYRNSIEPPKAVYGLKGDCVPEKFWPLEKEVDKEKKVIKVVADWTHSLPAFEFEFVPLKFTSETNPIGKILIWEFPEDGNIYCMPADTSDGLGQGQSDNSCVQMLRKGDRDRNDAQVLEFVSPEISGTALWPWTLAIGTMYAVLREGKKRQPKLVPETNREGGRNLLRFMQERGWKEIHEERRRAATRRGSVQVQYGLNLNPINRDNVLQWFKVAIEGEYIEVNSQFLVSEMGVFIRHDDGKWAAAKGKHDDRLMALAEGYWSLYDREARSTDKAPVIERPKVTNEADRYPSYYGEQNKQVSDLINSIVGR